MNEPIRIYSPARIEVLLHCHCRGAPLPTHDAPVIQDTVEEFLRLGVITRAKEPNCYNTTELGSAWVAALCRVPLPKKAFVDVDGALL